MPLSTINGALLPPHADTPQYHHVRAKHEDTLASKARPSAPLRLALPPLDTLQKIYYPRSFTMASYTHRFAHIRTYTHTHADKVGADIEEGGRIMRVHMMERGASRSIHQACSIFHHTNIQNLERQKRGGGAAKEDAWRPARVAYTPCSLLIQHQLRKSVSACPVMFNTPHCERAHC